MLKKILKIFLISVFFLLIIGISKNVEANSISKISMDIYVDNNGDATINEVWNCRADSGTEVYHPYYYLGKSEIENLEVSENGRKYQTLSSWNTSGSLSTKAYKCGINKISNGVELCWGISQYGSHTYNVKYTISNFIANLNDSQMIYWTFIPYDFSDPIGSAYIKVHTNFNIPDSVDVWGYGNYGGTAYVYDGYIEMQSDGRLDKDEYMTMLVKFPSGTFNTSNTINHDFNYYYNMAEEGSVKYNEKPTSFGEVVIKILSALINLIPLIIVWIVFFLSIKRFKDSGASKLNFGVGGKEIPKDVPYYRDIPCNKDIFRAYYIGYNYTLLKNKTDLLGAIILKWLKDSVIRIEKKEEGIFKKENILIYLNETMPETSIKNNTERKLFDMLYEASKDGVLENKEFEKWCNKSYSKILKWFDDILKEQRDLLVQEGKITVQEKTTLKVFKSKVYTATHELKEEAIQLEGLKRFLKEYTLIKDREPIEVTLFEEYLIYAQMLGIAKEVAKEFKEVYPKIIEESKFTSYDNIILINMYASHNIAIAKSAESRARSYSSGGGGFSSGGGGGGSFGGGGGRRRFPLIKNMTIIKESSKNELSNSIYFVELFLYEHLLINPSLYYLELPSLNLEIYCLMGMQLHLLLTQYLLKALSFYQYHELYLHVVEHHIGMLYIKLQILF